MDWTIRRACDDDAGVLEQCVKAAYQLYLSRMENPPGPMLADYAAEIAQHQVWVVEAEDRIIGGLVMIPHEDHLYLDNIVVDPAYQGFGVGRALLEHADAIAVQQGYDELRLYTHVTMIENISMYIHLGWVETHRARQEGYDRVFFNKSVEANG